MPSYSDPVITTNGGNQVVYQYAENSTSTITTLAATNPNGSGTLEWSLTTQYPDYALFAIDESTGELTWVASPDYEDPQDYDGDYGGIPWETDNSYWIVARCTHQPSGLYDELEVNVAVTNVTEGGADPTWPDQPGTFTRMIYVSVSGGGDGLSIGSPTTLAGANAMVQPGDKVAVAPGAYGNQSIDPAASGTSTNPIAYCGYTSTAPTLSTEGDTPNYGTTAVTQESGWSGRQLATRSNWHAGEYSANSSLMPVLDRGTRANDNYGIRVQSSIDHIHIRGFTVLNFQYLIHCLGAHCRLEDLFGAEAGRETSGYSYSGFGVTVTRPFGTAETAEGLRMRNVWIVNANAQAFSIYSTGCIVMGCGATCDRDGAIDGDVTALATDYYFNITGRDGFFKDIYVAFTPAIARNGHGVEIATIWAPSDAESGYDASGNVIDGVYAYNMQGGGVGTRRGTCFNNTIRNAVIIKGTGGNGIMSHDGPHDNTYEDILVVGCERGIWGFLAGEAYYDNPSGNSGTDQTYTRVEMRGVYWVIACDTAEAPTGKLVGSTINDLVVSTATEMYYFGGAGPGTGNVINDSTGTGIGGIGESVTTGQWQLVNCTGIPS